VHILPFFPYTSDDGFSVADYLSVNPDLGSWDDIAAISSEFWLMCDLVINHVSSDHAWFRNYLTDKSPGKDYFIEACTTDDYRNVIRPRNSPLFTDFQTTRGPRAVWTTFSADQVDLNFRNPAVLLEMIRVLLFYLSKGIRIIRLDAIAFLWKTTGTSCLHQPETHEIVKLLRTIVSFVSPGTIILTETNVPNRENWSYFGNGDEAHMVYQFSLPPLLLYTLYSGNTRYLNQWAREVPSLQQGQTFLNYTASHDGIGIRPLEGLLPQEEISNLMESMTGFGGMVSNRTGPDGSQSPYEMNITYLDALKGTVQGIDNLQEMRFICSQTIMMEMQGIPAFYLNSVLGTSNDYQGVNATGRARSINRRLWCENELLEQLSSNSRHRYLYHELTRLMNIRAKCSLFHPECQQEVLDYDKGVFALVRCNKATGEKMYCVSNVTLQLVEFTIKTEEKKKKYDLIACEISESSDRIRLNAYQTRWLVDKEIKG
jgi:sucrose phosphorylase